MLLLRLRTLVAQWASRLFLFKRRPGKSFGQRGEDAAARFLRARGYRILAKNDRSRVGEIDLIALDQKAAPKTIVFVEVKTRCTNNTGHPAEAVTLEKQRRLTRAALAWLKRHRLLDSPSRFDVVAVTWPEGQTQPTIEHFSNAFPATGGSRFFS